MITVLVMSPRLVHVFQRSWSCLLTKLPEPSYPLNSSVLEGSYSSPPGLKRRCSWRKEKLSATILLNSCPGKLCSFLPPWSHMALACAGPEEAHKILMNGGEASVLSAAWTRPDPCQRTRTRHLARHGQANKRLVTLSCLLRESPRALSPASASDITIWLPRMSRPVSSSRIFPSQPGRC